MDDETISAETLSLAGYIRLEALSLAVKTRSGHRVSTLEVIKRARHYEQYIKNGAFERQGNNG